MIPVDHIALKDDNMTLNLDLSRFERQFQRAQYDLDSTIMTDMEAFMPKQDGNFVNVTKAMSAAIAGSGRVVAAAPPFGRFLYYGKTMVDIETGSPFARPAAKKVLVSQFGGKTNAKENLDLSRGINPRAQAEWFEAAKKYYGKVWIRKAKKTAGGGQSG
ncbi:MAG: hypothetical protein J6B95_08195 [Oscillospiraceae bacterium]|nr:hypothetical protein [Oscillospiraceae bacterium]